MEDKLKERVYGSGHRVQIAKPIPRQPAMPPPQQTGGGYFPSSLEKPRKTRELE